MAQSTCWAASAIDNQEETETRKGPWTVEEDLQLASYISLHGQGRWSFLAKAAGLNRNGRSCRLRWINYLRPDLKRSKITPEEERLILELHDRWGNKWSRIAQSLPGRTDNEIKNYWRTRIKKKLDLQENGSSSMDADNRVDQFERSTDSYCRTASQELPDLDAAEPTSFPTQDTEEIAVQTNRNPYLQNDILPQQIPVIEVNYEYGLQEEIHGTEIDDDGQPRAILQEHLEGSDDLFGKRSPYNFSLDSLAIQLSSDADGGTQYGKTPTSPQAFSDSESYLNCYWDVLWNHG